MRTLRTSYAAAVAFVTESICVEALPVGECATESPKLKLRYRLIRVELSGMS
jgi:hypothetical protein